MRRYALRRRSLERTRRYFWMRARMWLLLREDYAYLRGVFLKYAKPKDLGWWQR